MKDNQLNTFDKEVRRNIIRQSVKPYRKGLTKPKLKLPLKATKPKRAVLPLSSRWPPAP